MTTTNKDFEYLKNCHKYYFNFIMDCCDINYCNKQKWKRLINFYITQYSSPSSFINVAKEHYMEFFIDNIYKIICKSIEDKEILGYIIKSVLITANEKKIHSNSKSFNCKFFRKHSNFTF